MWNHPPRQFCIAINIIFKTYKDTNMKLVVGILIACATVLCGCSSMQPVDERTRMFLERMPDVDNNFQTSVQTIYGDRITMKAGDARFTSENGKEILRGTIIQDWVGGQAADMNEKPAAIPVSEIQAISIDNNITIHTGDQKELVAQAGTWWLWNNATDTAGYPTTPSYKSNPINNRDALRTASFLCKDTTIAARDITDMEFEYADAGRTALLIGGIIAGTIICFVAGFESSGGLIHLNGSFNNSN